MQENDIEIRACIYCHEEVDKKAPYSMRHMGGYTYYWHYKCYLKEEKILLEVSKDVIDYLIGKVLQEPPTEFTAKALKELGYGTI